MVMRTVKLHLCVVAVAAAVSVVAAASAGAGAGAAQSELGTLGHESNSPCCLSLSLFLYNMPFFLSLSLSRSKQSGRLLPTTRSELCR